MKRFKHAIAIITGALILGLVAEAGAAAEFSPTITFDLGDKAANANSTLRVVVKQETGEEELKTVELHIPPGFGLALDQQLTNGETLGAGSIVIDAGPRCRGVGPVSAPATVNVTITERDRNTSQIARGVEAVYFVDIQGITSITLEVTGSSAKGWTLEGPVPPNDNTCPPFSFDATFRARSSGSNTPILTNPQFGGDYEFSAKFVGLADSVSQSKANVTIQGPSGGGGGGAITQTTGTKSCKGLKGKKKKRCKKKLGG